MPEGKEFCGPKGKVVMTKGNASNNLKHTVAKGFLWAKR